MILIWSAQQQYPGQALALPIRRWRCPPAAASRPSLPRSSLATALVYGGLFLFLQFGRWGVRMRATGQNPLLAAQRGINLHAVYALAWDLSTLTGSMAGMLIALDSGLTKLDGHYRAQGVSRRSGRRARQSG